MPLGKMHTFSETKQNKFHCQETTHFMKNDEIGNFNPLLLVGKKISIPSFRPFASARKSNGSQLPS